MGILRYVDRFKRIDDLVRRRATGSPDDFARKLGISKSMLMLNLAELRELGAPLKYSAVESTYYYDFKGRFNFGFISNNDELNRLQLDVSNNEK